MASRVITSKLLRDPADVKVFPPDHPCFLVLEPMREPHGCGSVTGEPAALRASRQPDRPRGEHTHRLGIEPDRRPLGAHGGNQPVGRTGPAGLVRRGQGQGRAFAEPRPGGEVVLQRDLAAVLELQGRLQRLKARRGKGLGVADLAGETLDRDLDPRAVEDDVHHVGPPHLASSAAPSAVDTLSVRKIQSYHPNPVTPAMHAFAVLRWLKTGHVPLTPASCPALPPPRSRASRSSTPPRGWKEEGPPSRSPVSLFPARLGQEVRF